MHLEHVLCTAMVRRGLSAKPLYNLCFNVFQTDIPQSLSLHLLNTGDKVNHNKVIQKEKKLQTKEKREMVRFDNFRRRKRRIIAC